MLSKVVMLPTWLTRTASLLLAFHLRYVKSAMCPRQMATLRFPASWKAPLKDQLRNVSVNGKDAFHRETISKRPWAKFGPMCGNRSAVCLFCFVCFFWPGFLVESIPSIA